jgi:hypothetical protein
MKRRQFNKMLGTVGLSLSPRGRRNENNSYHSARTDSTRPKRLEPKNDHLPALLYKNAITVEGANPAALFEAQFQRNGWPPQWRDGVYGFHHYHSTAH